MIHGKEFLPHRTGQEDCAVYPRSVVKGFVPTQQTGKRRIVSVLGKGVMGLVFPSTHPRSSWHHQSHVGAYFILPLFENAPLYALMRKGSRLELA